MLATIKGKKGFYLKKAIKSADQDRKQDKCLWKISLKLSKNSRVLMSQTNRSVPSFKAEEFYKSNFLIKGLF